MANFSICACQHLRLSDLGTLLDLCLSAHMRKQLGTLLGFVHLGRTQTEVRQAHPQICKKTSSAPQAHEIGREVSNNGELARHPLTEPYMQKVRLFFPKLRDSVSVLEKAGTASCAC